MNGGERAGREGDMRREAESSELPAFDYASIQLQGDADVVPGDVAADDMPAPPLSHNSQGASIASASGDFASLTEGGQGGASKGASGAWTEHDYSRLVHAMKKFPGELEKERKGECVCLCGHDQA